MNPREFELLNLLSLRDAVGGTVPKSVRLAQTLAADPTAPAMTDLMAVAARTAAGDVIATVSAYCKAHPEYAEMLDLFNRFAQESELPEPPIEESILGRMTVNEFERSRTNPVSLVSGAVDVSGRLPLRLAARTKGVPIDEVNRAIAAGELDAVARDNDKWVSVQSLTVWQPLPRPRPSDALEHAMAVSENTRGDVWLVHRLSPDTVLVVADPKTVSCAGQGPGAIVRLDVPGFGPTEGQLRYLDGEVAMVVVHSGKEGQ